MNEREFCYWLQGVMEVSNPATLGPEQVQVIKDHLKLVFTKVTPKQTPIPDYMRALQGVGIGVAPNAMAYC